MATLKILKFLFSGDIFPGGIIPLGLFPDTKMSDVTIIYHPFWVIFVVIFAPDFKPQQRGFL